MVRKFHHQEKRIIALSDSLTHQQFYNIVKNVKHYPEFLPWCLSAHIIENGEDFFIADLLVGFKTIREKFRSKVFFDDKKKEIITKGTSQGPLSTMDSHWLFYKINDNECEVHFSVSLTFSSIITEKLFAPFFNQAIKKMTTAFLTRAKSLE
ncbi:MAG: type II toxin-antitoxin system RatA family toxin [Alphaproteobacteria bacterium]